MRSMIRALVIGLGVAGFALAGTAPVAAQSTLKEKAAAVKEKAKERYQRAKQAVKERVTRVKEKVAEKKAVVAEKVAIKKAAAKPVRVYQAKAKPAPRRIVKKRYAKCKGIAGKGYGLGKDIASAFAVEALKEAAAKHGPGRLSKPRIACAADNVSCIARARLCR